jgi:hypothetical protein
MRPPTPALLAVALLLVGALLSGCVSPPDSGPIRPGIAGPVEPAPQPLVRPIASPPRDGMQPVEIVAGFLAAAAAVGDDLDVARQYLTGQASADWEPGAGVTLFEGESPTLTPVGSTVTAEYVVVGTVSASGVPSDTSPTPASFDFPVEEIEGQWRIAQAPPGLLLSRGAFSQAFTSGNAYFIAPSGRWTVPDVRAVPRTPSQSLATALLNGLLAGPSAWLAGSATTAIPEGLQLALGAVPVVDGVARVELLGPEPLIDDATAGAFGAQIAWTLRQVPGVTGFEVLINGSRVPLTGGRGPIPLSTYDDYNPDVLAGTTALAGLGASGEPVEVVGGKVAAFAAGTAPDGGAAPALASIAVSPTGGLVAGAAADRASMLIGNRRQPGRPMQVIASPVASGPSIDGLDRVWWTDAAGRVQVATADASGRYTAAAVQTGAAGPVASIRPSRDGSRAVLILADSQAYLAAIVSDQGGLQLRGTVALGPRRAVSGVAWRDADEVTLVVPDTEVAERLDLLGRPVGAFSIPSGVRGITDAPADPVVLALPDGTAGPLSGSGVRPIPGLSAPAYPG